MNYVIMEKENYYCYGSSEETFFVLLRKRKTIRFGMIDKKGLFK